MRLVEPHRFRAILAGIFAERTNYSNDAILRLWWREGLKEPVAYTVPPDPIAFIRRLLRQDESVWLVAEDEGDKTIGNFWLYEGTVSAVLQECPAFEYYIVEKKMERLICENPHGLASTIGSAQTLNARFQEDQYYTEIL
ncbi:conserved hypothetical protein [Candidatus Methylobacter favarea]|uniref:Uncharacterized protein n=1 Tax=Candidatus Methylobacter favarea TaxID=2707345 RepID=A0A8S0XJ21_9GAMM|nr:DUF6756 family protein [Candidatus Methylobacter favarea]CAA9892853.1 conserved hypothetical protein [Candidatus Methylobacter favarea]